MTFITNFNLVFTQLYWLLFILQDFNILQKIRDFLFYIFILQKRKTMRDMKTDGIISQQQRLQQKPNGIGQETRITIYVIDVLFMFSSTCSTRDTTLALSIESLPNKSGGGQVGGPHWSMSQGSGPVVRPRSTININDRGQYTLF